MNQFAGLCGVIAAQPDHDGGESSESGGSGNSSDNSDSGNMVQPGAVFRVWMTSQRSG
ncbi:MAG: hypothetical protein GKR97_05985 [Rhizobiaceae bacterium]|nr:hypothetical protein [Rhizobiaceae bacterium]